MNLTTYQIIGIAFSIFSVLAVCVVIPLAWGRWQQWKEDTEKWKKSIERKMLIIDDIDDCMKEMDRLNTKLYTKDGTPSYITSGVCKGNMERINENFSNQKDYVNEKINSLKIDVDHLSRISVAKQDFESMYSMLGKILEKINTHQRDN